jgi:hypothetical protein
MLNLHTRKQLRYFSMGRLQACALIHIKAIRQHAASAAI